MARKLLADAVPRACGKLMPSIKVAQLHEQGQDMVVVIMTADFAKAPPPQQEATIKQLQSLSNASGLKGIVVMVWEANGEMNFLAPQPWREFFESITLEDVRARINAEINW